MNLFTNRSCNATGGVLSFGMQVAREKIQRLEAELKTLKRMARCPHAPSKGIGGAIQRARQERGISMGQLSESSSIAKGNISRIETTANPNPKLNTLIAIAQALGVKTTELLNEAQIA